MLSEILPGMPEDAGTEGQAECEMEQQQVTVPCEDIGGVAGTGKTFLVRQRIADDPSWGLLCATTGIAAVNLGATTLNSALGFFDTASLKDAYLSGQLVRRLHAIAQEHRNLIIDEKSMMDKLQLEVIYRAVTAVNEYSDMRGRPFGIVLVGDFAQLPPVNAQFAFMADCWPEFAARSTKLTKIWRQEQLEFLNALNAARRGDGGLAAEILSSVGVRWETSLITEFTGTTLVPKNDQVDRFNEMSLMHVRGRAFSVTSRSWGKLRGEWKGIPSTAQFKVGAYVMILNNASDGEGGFAYVNGDCGIIEDWDGTEFHVRLVRGDRLVRVPKLVRAVASKDKPEGWPDEAYRTDGYHARLHRDAKGKYVSGQVEYYPVRLAFASTVHKSQGLSLDKLQVDIRNNFFSHPSMMYVALSRCRTLEGLRIVGQRERFIKNCNADIRVKDYL